MDISETTTPRSDQQNFDDYAAGPKLVTISEVRKGSVEQPVEIHLVEFPGRPYKPSKSMRRVLLAAWGADTSVYGGRKMQLYGDPSVKFGGVATGGIKIGGLSHIDKPMTVQLTATRGKRAPHTVEPLATLPPITDDDALDFARAISEAATVAELEELKAQLKTRDLGTHRTQLQTAWTGRNNELKGTT